MANESNIKLMIAFNDPNLDADEKDEEVQKLLEQMKDMDEVEAVDRVLDPNPPEGNKALGGFLVGLLMTEVNPANIKKLMGFLGERLGGKPIEMTLKAPDGRELSVKASSQAEFEFVMRQAQEFLKAKA